MHYNYKPRGIMPKLGDTVICTKGQRAGLAFVVTSLSEQGDPMGDRSGDHLHRSWFTDPGEHENRIIVPEDD